MRHTLDARAHDMLWRLAPGVIYRRLRTWRPVRVETRVFRIPMMSGRHAALDRLRQRWRREVLVNLVPPGPPGGEYAIDVGAGFGEMLIDLQCARPMLRYAGSSPAGRARNTWRS